LPGKWGVIGAALGTAFGIVAGSEAGRSLDRADQLHAEQAAQRSLEYDRNWDTSKWRNPDTGHAGTITPTKTWYEGPSQDQYPCREFRATGRIGDKAEQVIMEACRGPDGTWRQKI